MIIDTLWLDTETYCEIPIKNGTYAYAERCEVDIITFAPDDGDVVRIDVANGPRGDLSLFTDAIAESRVLVAHNAMFDRNALRLGNLKIDIPIKKWRCSMVRAMAHGFPGSLDKLGAIVGIPQGQRKLKEGHNLMMLFCKPRPNSKIRRATKATHPEEWARYLDYADQDVVAMRAIAKRLPAWNYTYEEPTDPPRPRDLEVMHWHRDQAINDRGAAVDLDLVNACLTAVDKEQARLKERTQEVTSYDPETGEGLSSTTRRDKMLQYLAEQHGMLLSDLRGATIERLVDDDELDPAIREMLRLRLQASSTSTSKYKALAKATTRGRIRGTIQFDGAMRTRRAAGRTFQPQNLPSRGLLKQSKIDLGVQALLAGAEDLFFDDVMLLTTSTIRGCLTGSEGRPLAVADLSNIEGRGLAWLGEENWKLDAFREFDTQLTTSGIWLSGPEYRELILAGDRPVLELDEKGEPVRRGADLYKLAYAKAFRIDHTEVTKFGRSVGKVMELGLGYAGGVNAFVTFALVYGIDLEEMAATAWPTLPEDKIKEAEDFLDWLEKQGTAYPMSRKAATVCEVFKRLWREAHPATVALWKALEDLFVRATETPGETFRSGRFAARRDGNWLRIVLSSGRALVYPFPQVKEVGKPRADGRRRLECSFMGVNQYNRQWSRIKTYSGKLTENACQSFARDILYDGMPAIEDAGYDICLHVHDEDVTEAPAGRPDRDSTYLSALMATPPGYALDFPLAAAGYDSYRYKKD